MRRTGADMASSGKATGLTERLSAPVLRVCVLVGCAGFWGGVASLTGVL